MTLDAVALTAAEQRLLAAVESLQGELRDLLVELVRCESVNPPGDTRKAARVCADMLRTFADDVQEVGPDSLMPNLLAAVNAGQAPQLLFNSHIDTVPIGERANWRHDPFGGECVDGVLYGRGSADAKGCVAPMIIAGKALKRSGLALKGSLVINPVSDEEVGGSKGAGWLVAQGVIKPDWVVIGEITTNRIAISHKGIVQFRIVTHGRTAHASTPWAGVNAISHMVTILSRIESELGLALSQRSHPLTPPPSFNIGMIRGGVKANVVADRCEVELDRRILPTERLADAVAEVKDIVASVQQNNPAMHAEVEVFLTGSALDTRADEPLVKTALAASQALGLPGEPVGYQQASDGRFFSERGIPTILVGPGIPERAHTPDEHISLADVYEAAKLYALIAYRLLASP